MPQPKQILVYRLGSLGDTVVALPCFHLVRRTFPSAHIVLLTNEPVSGKAAPAMAILQNSGLCDEVVSYPVGTRSRAKLAKLHQEIRRIRPEIVVNLAASRGLLKSLRDYVFFRSCGVKKIIGTPFHRRQLRVELCSDGLHESEAQRLASRLASLGDLNLADRELWKLKLTMEEQSSALELSPLHQRGFMAMSVGTKLIVKDWGEDNWGKLLALLAKELPDIGLVLLGAPDEWDRSEKLRRFWTGSSWNLCGKTSPRISAAILEHARLFIGHDSGPLHLASAVGIPTLGLFSWFNPPGQWFPGHRDWKTNKVLYPPLPAGGWHIGLQMKHGAADGIQLTKPDDVFRSAMELWRAKSSQST